MSPATFTTLTAIVKKRSGGVLHADQGYMLQTRLAPLLKRENLVSLDALAMRLQGLGQDLLAAEMTELLTTNESSFFRDGRPFEHLRTLLPALHRARAPGLPLRIWSAACSTGQEAYSISMVVGELGLAGRRVEILGTDITGAVLDRARAATYSAFEVQRGLTPPRLERHFLKEGAGWRVKPEVSQRCRFERHNLLEDARPLGRFDVVFCRNVLIYLDVPTKGQVLERLSGVVAADGALYLGASETALGVTDRFAGIPGERGAYAPQPTRLRA